MNRRDFIGYASLAGLGAMFPNWTIDRPNIIFLMTDDLGIGDLGCYGQAQIQTPNIDAMAAAGIRFTQCYSPTPVCAPTRWCIQTGKHIGHARGCINEGVLYPADRTIGQEMQHLGYSTGCIGKWAMSGYGSGWPNDYGYDFFYGYESNLAAHAFYPEYLWRNRTKEYIPENAGGQKVIYAPDLLIRETLDFIGRQTGPYFLYLPYTFPHTNNEEYAITGNGMEIPDDSPYSAEPWPQPERNFAAMVTRLDDQVRQIIEATAGTNTIIFFTSDNGGHNEGGHNIEFFNSNGLYRGFKRDLYEGGIHVPFIAYWPGHVAPAVCDHPVALYDMMPTVLDLAGACAMPGTDGLSFMPSLFGQYQSQRDYFYWAFHENGILKEAVRIGYWKAVRIDNGQVELYNLDSDPGETENVAMCNQDAVCRALGIMERFCPKPDICKVTFPVMWK